MTYVASQLTHVQVSLNVSVYNGGCTGLQRLTGDENSGRGAVLIGKCQFTRCGVAGEGI